MRNYKSKRKSYLIKGRKYAIISAILILVIILIPTFSILINQNKVYQNNNTLIKTSYKLEYEGLYQGRISTIGRKMEVFNSFSNENESSYTIQYYQKYNGFNYSLNNLNIRAYNLFNGSGISDIATDISEKINISGDFSSVGYIVAQEFKTPETTDLLSITNFSLYIEYDIEAEKSPIYFVSLLDKDFREVIALSIQPAEIGFIDKWVTFNLSNNILEPGIEYNLVYFLAVKQGPTIFSYNVSEEPTWKAENKSLTPYDDNGRTCFYNGTDYVPITNNNTIDLLCNFSYRKIVNPEKVNLKYEVNGVEYIPIYQKSLATGSLGYEAELNYGFPTSPTEDVNITILTNETLESLEIEIKQYYIYSLNASGLYKINDNTIEWNITYQNYDIGSSKEELRFLYESDWVLSEFYNTIGTPVELASIAISFYNDTYLSLFDPEGIPLGTGNCIAIYQSPNYCENIITKIKEGSDFQKSSYLQLGKTIKLEALIQNSNNEPISGGKGNLILKSPSGQMLYNESNLISYSGILSSSEIILDTKYGAGSYSIELFWTNGKEIAIYSVSVDVGPPEGYIPPETIILLITFIGITILATPAALVARKYIRQINWEKSLHDLFILTKEGVSMYNFSFGIEIRKPELISGMISALTTFMKEAIGSKEAARIIDQQDKKIMLNHGQYVTVALISNKNLPIIHKRLKKFTEAFEIKYGKQLLKWNGDVTMFKDAESIVKKYFTVSIEDQKIRGAREKLLEFRERLLSVDDKKQIISIMREITEFSSKYQQIINNYSFKEFNELIRIVEYKINE